MTTPPPSLNPASKHITEPLYISTRPLTFEHAGKRWTWHKSGDACPCDGDSVVFALREDRRGLRVSNPQPASFWWWHDSNILGWRYAEPATREVELGPEDVAPGSVFRWPDCSWVVIDLVCGNGLSTTKHGLIKWKDANAGGGKINRSIPLTGKWNPDSWEPCHKPSNPPQPVYPPALR